MPNLQEANRLCAALPWYNFAATRKVLESVWRDARRQLVAAGIVDLPVILDQQGVCLESPTARKLILSQCCGLDLFNRKTCHVVPIAAPVIATLEVPAGKYISYIVAKRGASLPERLTVVINDQYSHSGNTAVMTWLAQHNQPNLCIRVSGSHQNSVQEVQSGQADVASIDALSWQFIDTRELVILATSQAMPAPPFIAGTDSQIPNAALVAALDGAFGRHGSAMGIIGVVPVTAYDYLEIGQQALKYGVLTDSSVVPDAIERWGEFG